MGDHLCPGASACPTCDPGGWAAQIGDGSGGVTQGMAARIAEGILTDPCAPSSTMPAPVEHANPHLNGYGRRGGLY